LSENANKDHLSLAETQVGAELGNANLHNLSMPLKQTTAVYNCSFFLHPEKN